MQLLLKIGFLFFKTLDLLFHFINFSRVLSVSFIKLVPHIESLVKALGNLGILLRKEVLIVYSLIQSMRLQERSVGTSYKAKDDKSKITITRYGARLMGGDIPW